jgi:cytochrome c-type biogenesis protein CcmH
VNPLILLYGLLCLLATCVVIYVMRPLWRRAAAGREGDASAIALSVLRERRRELESALADLPADSPERRSALAEFAAQTQQELPQPLNTPDTAQQRAGDSAPQSARRNPWLTAVLAATLIVPPAALYWMAGAPDAADPIVRSEREPASLEELVATLRERLKRSPDQVQGWQLLGRSEMALGRIPEAQAAFERALALAPGDAQTRVDLADAIAQGQGSVLTGRPIQLIREALASDPKQPKALALAGAYEVSQGNPSGAIAHWRALLAVLPADSPQAAQIAGYLANLEAGRTPLAAGPSSPAAAPPPAPQAAPSQAGASIRGRVELDPALAARLDPDATLFVVARSLDDQGRPSGPPLAVIRARAAELPLAFELDDRQAMSPMARLSSLPPNAQVMVIARVSKSADASVKAGDLQGRSGTVAPGSADVRVRIDTVAE